MWRVFIQQNPTLRSVHARFTGYPGWVVRTAFLCAVATILLPLMLLAFVAACVGVIVFFVLLGVAKVMSLFDRGAADNDAMRRNVRVVEEDRAM